jgi:hypothetical protein
VITGVCIFDTIAASLSYGPEGCPNNLPQPAWCLAELFFWSDLS